jgi:DNA-binding NtrC family response regulator
VKLAVVIVADLVQHSLSTIDFDYIICSDFDSASAALCQRSFDAIVVDSDLAAPAALGLPAVSPARNSARPLIVLVNSDAAGAEAVARGAFCYLLKPHSPAELAALIARVLATSRIPARVVPFNGAVSQRVVGLPDRYVAKSPSSLEKLALIRKVAPSRATVMLQGESGTGKEMAARLIHLWSDRSTGPFIAVNCGAFAEGVLESELFGHEKGSFTGAGRAHAGCFERASGGTLLLDEIGEVGLDFQTKLLRVLQDGEVLPVGGTRPYQADTRVIVATSRVLRDEVAAGRFSEPLFFRVNVSPIVLTPLRERREDILPLAYHFLARESASRGGVLCFSAEAEELLLGYRWPGNVRELENLVSRSSVLCTGDTVQADDLMLERLAPEPSAKSGIENHAAPAAVPAAPPDPLFDGSLQESIDRAVSIRIRRALRDARGNRSQAARALAIDRTTLYRLMRRLSL